MLRSGSLAADEFFVTGAMIRTRIDEAGASAREHADLLEPLIDGTERQIVGLRDALSALRREQRHYRVGAAAERRAASKVQQVLVDLGSCDWHLLADRRWPGTRSANLDLILVGPPGVILLDVKAWTEPRLEGGSLWCGQENVDDKLGAALRAADAVAAVLGDTGLAPAAVRPVFVLLGRKSAAVDVGGVTVVGELALHRALARLGSRLTAAQIATVVAAVDERCPPASRAASRSRRSTRTVRAAPEPSLQEGPGAFNAPLVDTSELWSCLLDAAMREPIESWMTWMHPRQVGLVSRRYSGPARIRGAAGTGKTVVALHRARELAKGPRARILVTSYVRTLPVVQSALFKRLAPDLSTRVEFVGLHGWATRLLRQHQRRFQLARDGGRSAFEEAWRAVGVSGLLGESLLPHHYWREEIEHVIKGRGLAEAGSYLALDRVGRRTPLREDQRLAVWSLYEEYQRRLRAADEVDWPDVLLLALDEVRRDPPVPDYTAVIVDEVQDLSCTGLRLLHALVGDAPDGLLLVGDGQQAVYPGGFTLAEAGVSVHGRAAVLNRNYRNAAEIMEAAFAIVRSDTFDDLDPSPVAGARVVEVDRRGGRVAQRTFLHAAEQRVGLLRALRSANDDGVRLGDMAVLAAGNRAAARWAATLLDAGVPVELLKGEYDGTTSDAVKVGTYQRAKGLEFGCVFIPDRHRAVSPRNAGESDDMFQERTELQRRQLFVAMTRARDRLWLGAVC